MEEHRLSDNLERKVSRAAEDSYKEYDSGFEKMEPEQVFKAAYIHGYNCAYNIYDVAEEKVEGMIKEGNTPTKDIPDKSVSAVDDAERFISRHDNVIACRDMRSVYTEGYSKGFEGAWTKYVDAPMNEQLEDVVDYYLSGKRESSKYEF